MNLTEQSSSFDIRQLPLGTFPKALELPHFPTRLQAFIWRNWELVPVEKLAQIISATESEVLDLAIGMGLRLPPKVGPHWLTHGYATLIRANWHLLPYEQLLELLDWTAERLDFVLRVDDFLWVKLGCLKPDCEPIRYEPLTAEQLEETESLRHVLQSNFPNLAEEESASPFDFLHDLEVGATVTPRDWADSAKAAGEISLDERWSVLLPVEQKAGNLPHFVGDFIETHQARWGVQLDVSESAVSQQIQFSLNPDFEGPRESHSVEIGANSIIITTADETGLLRGLQWLQTAMDQRNAPFLTVGTTKRTTRFDLRLIHPFNGASGDALSEMDSFPDGMLAQLSQVGVNGIWIQGLLSSLYPWDLAPELSAGYEERLTNLKRMAKQAARHGIGLYLYLNEPRGLPFHVLDEHPELRELTGPEYTDLLTAAMCTSTPQVMDYLRDSTAFVFGEVPELAGVFTISMSENPTNCYAIPNNNPCPRCSKRPLAAVIAEVNAAIAEGVQSAQPKARVVAWTWGGDWPVEALDLLPPGVEIMSVREEALVMNVGGIESSILDYSMSQVEPGPKALKFWKKARERGLKTVAKVQVNTTWECSAVPYLPVPDLVEENLTRIEVEGVNGLMLSWTVGGYPSFNLELAMRHFWRDDQPLSGMDSFAADSFGSAAAPAIGAAWYSFSAAFREFPFHLMVVYMAPVTGGPMNLLYADPTGFAATMVGIPYDDLTAWRAVYPEDVFEAQWKLLSDEWKVGLSRLEAVDISALSPDNRAKFQQMHNMALGAYLHFYSTYLQVVFVRRRNELISSEGSVSRQELIREILYTLDEEIIVATTMHELVRRDSLIGFEASNHYYYTVQDLREKVLNCHYLRAHFLREQVLA